MEEESKTNTLERRSSTAANKDENQDRGNWDSKADYMLSCIGYAVGLGNVWRFPYLAFDNGGGAFLIPYVIMLVLAGLPIFFLECALGQFSSLGPISCFKFSPIVKGIGYCMVVLNIIVTIYYNVIIAYTVFYFFSSLTSVLPWSNCENYWNNASSCRTEIERICTLNVSNESLGNADVQTYLSSRNLTNGIQILVTNAQNISALLEANYTDICVNETTYKGTTASEDYFNNYALQRSANLSETGHVVTPLALSLLVAWVIVYFSMIRGIKSSGKVVYFTALFPYVVLLILLIRGATLPGAIDGIQFYIGNQSELSKLMDAKVWQQAATQIFFSLSAAWGGLIALSSYNKFNNNCFLDSIIVCTVNCATSIFAGLAIFTVIGHMAYKLGTTVREVAQDGFGLAFIAYPEAILNLPFPPIWSILFFLMLITLGLDSQFTGLEAILTAAMDMFPRQLRSRRTVFTLSACIFCFLLAIPCVTQSGIYWLVLVDHYTAGWGLLINAVCEVVGVAWIYGGNRFIKDIEMMIGERHWAFWIYWRVCWFFVTPLLLLGILIWSLATFKATTYAGIPYPAWGDRLGWCSVMAAIVFIPVMAVVAVIRARGNLFKACSPRPDWGPYLKKFRGDRYKDMDEPVEALELRNRSAGEANPGYEVEFNVHQEEETTKI